VTAATTRAVLFDFGGVFTPSPFDGARHYGAQIGADPQRVLELVFGPYHEDTDHPWHCLERGELALADARSAIIALGEAEGVDADPFKLFASMAASPRGVHDEMVERARAVAARGYRTALVTNNVVEFRDQWRRMLPADELFQVIVDSSEVGMRKPNPAIFRHTLALLGDVAPGECLFLDDAESNVEAARRLGIRGVVVKPDLRDALAALDALL
jgi:epoxide hydrolase-like predicted phosphatase